MLGVARPGTKNVRWIMAAVSLALACVLTWHVMRLSMERGRLATYPRVDDVIYMARGAELWRAGSDGWARGGAIRMIKSVARDWRRDPPHSPWASGCAALGFGVFGVKEWGAYIFTGVPVAMFVLAAARIGRRAGGRRGWGGIGLALVGASAPFLAASEQNLKPDYFTGILSAVGIIVMLRGPMLTSRPKRLAWAGAMFGLALLAKPAMMVATCLLCIGTVAICAVRDSILAGRGSELIRSMWLTARAAAWVAGTAIVVALPHYVFALGHAWRYTLHVLDGESWAYPGTAAQRALYYLTGPGARLMLDGLRTLAPIAAVVVAYGIAAGVGAGRRGVLGSRRAMYFAAMLGAVAMAWAGPTMATAKISQFAAAFDALAWFVGVYAIAGLVRPGRSRWARAGAWAMAAFLVVTWRPTFPMLPADYATPARVAIQDRDRLVRNLYSAILAAARGRESTRVLVAGSPNELGEPLLRFWSIRDGQRWSVREVRRVPEAGGSQTAEAIALAIFGQSDVIVVCEPGSGLTRPKLATQGADQFYLDLAERDSEFRRVGKVLEPATGKSAYVFTRAAWTTDTESK